MGDPIHLLVHCGGCLSTVSRVADRLLILKCGHIYHHNCVLENSKEFETGKELFFCDFCERASAYGLLVKSQCNAFVLKASPRNLHSDIVRFYYYLKRNIPYEVPSYSQSFVIWGYDSGDSFFQ